SDHLAGELCDQTAAPEHEHSIAQFRKLLVLRAGDNDGSTTIGDLTQPTKDLATSADVDPLRGLMRKQHHRVELQPLRQHKLLLLAAAERRKRLPRLVRSDIEFIHHRFDTPLLPAVMKTATAVGESIDSDERNVLDRRRGPRSTEASAIRGD